ncbi:unnamed protein product, partial [Ilex paraguariensis]
KIPNKIKFFAWGVCSNAPPTTDNLLQRRVDVVGQYGVCQIVDESLIHCPWAIAVWRSLHWLQWLSWISLTQESDFVRPIEFLLLKTNPSFLSCVSLYGEIGISGSLRMCCMILQK